MLLSIYKACDYKFSRIINFFRNKKCIFAPKKYVTVKFLRTRMNNLSETILNYAKDVNNHGNGVIYYRYRNKDPEQYEAAATFFSSAIGNLYNAVHQNGGISLINCPDESMKEIGMAYMKIAQIYKAGKEDWYVNSVSAENAFYCLVRYYKRTGDSSSIPYLFMLLKANKDLLEDKFEQSWKKLNSRLINRPFGAGLIGDTLLSACLRYYHIYVLHHMLTISYDIKQGKPLIEDKTFAFLYPNFSNTVNSFMEMYADYDRDEYANDREELGKTYFDTIYDLCENVLKEY